MAAEEIGGFPRGVIELIPVAIAVSESHCTAWVSPIQELALDASTGSQPPW